MPESEPVTIALGAMQGRYPQCETRTPPARPCPSTARGHDAFARAWSDAARTSRGPGSAYVAPHGAARYRRAHRARARNLLPRLTSVLALPRRSRRTVRRPEGRRDL